MEMAHRFSQVSRFKKLMIPKTQELLSILSKYCSIDSFQLYLVMRLGFDFTSDIAIDDLTIRDVAAGA